MLWFKKKSSGYNYPPPPFPQVTIPIRMFLFYFSLEVESQDNEKMIIKFGPNKAILNASPFRLDIFTDDQLVISANARGLLKFEQYRLKTEQ